MAAAMVKVLGALGMVPVAPLLPAPPPPSHLCIQVRRLLTHLLLLLLYQEQHLLDIRQHLLDRLC